MSLDTLMTKLECATSTAIEWFRNNGMKLNSSKYKLLVCGHKLENMICKIENSLVIETHQVKLLGMKIGCEVTFNSYVQTIM